MRNGTTETIALVDAVERIEACCAPGITTPRLQDVEARSAADLFKALADPTRLQILDMLAQHGREVCVCDLEGIVGLPDAQGQRRQPTISHHLRVLRDAGLVGYEKRGQWAYYYVIRERLDAAMHVVRMLRP